MKSDKELAEQLDADKRIRSHGYKKKTCPYCNGIGIDQSPRRNYVGTRCYPCGGKGYTWEAPLMC